MDYRTNLGELPTANTFRSGNNVSLRISLSASQLTSPSFVVSSTFIQVQVKYLTWFDYHRTEVRRSTDPVFEQPAIFNFDYSLTTKMNDTRLRLIVYHDSGHQGTVQDGGSAVDLAGFVPFGVAECRIRDITHARTVSDDHGYLELRLIDSNDRTQTSAGIVKLEVKDLVPMLQQERAQDGAAHSKVARLGAKIQGPVFRFETVSNNEVRAREVMGESAYFQIVPSKLLEIYTKEDTAAIRELQALDAVLGREDWDDIVRPVFDHLLKRQALYHSHTAILDSHQGSTFRPSVEKKSDSLEMTPLNCHIQRLEVLDRGKEDQVLAMYDIITHGAPAAHSLKFSHGGLRRILKEKADARWLEYREEGAKIKQHLHSIQDIIDSSALKLINSFGDLVKKKLMNDTEHPSFVYIPARLGVVGEAGLADAAKPLSPVDNILISEARKDGKSSVKLKTDLSSSTSAGLQQFEVRFGAAAVSARWASPPSSGMLLVNLATDESFRVEESAGQRTKISEEAVCEIDKLVGVAEFFGGFLRDYTQHTLIHEALSDTMELRQRKLRTWTPTGPNEAQMSEANTMATNPFMPLAKHTGGSHKSNRDDDMPARVLPPNTKFGYIDQAGKIVPYSAKDNAKICGAIVRGESTISIAPVLLKDGQKQELEVRFVTNTMKGELSYAAPPKMIQFNQTTGDTRFVEELDNTDAPEHGNGSGEGSDGGSRPRRRMASYEKGSRSRAQLLAELNLCTKNLLDVKDSDIIEIISYLNDLRRTVKAAVHEIVSAVLIKELQLRADHLDEIEHRRDVVFSQACTILVTAFVSSLRIHSKDPVFLKQLLEIGYLAQFESLLSTHGNEMGMIEDMSQACLDLKRVTFKLCCASDGSRAFQSLFLSGRRYEICIEVAIHRSFYDRLPEELKNGETIQVVPIFFSHGVNEMQTLANKIGVTDLQEEIVQQGFEDLQKYALSYKKKVCPDLPIAQVKQTEQELDKLMVELDKAIKMKKAKNVQILVAAQRIARRMKAGRLTCCKSGKDRTGMSATLEQCNILIDNHHMDPRQLSSALDVMRSIGTRMDNVEKNIGERKYAFNKLQIVALPKLLRPPLVSIGSQVT